jgi:hypothetical protein
MRAMLRTLALPPGPIRLYIVIMRISTELAVKALIRRCQSAGAAAFVVRHGDDERGALFVKVAMLDGRAKLLGPPPALLSDTGRSRTLEHHMAEDGAPERDVDAYLARQIEFDPDLWLVEIEDREGRTFLDE